jgi:epoxyqueuosine reductase
MNEKDWLEMTEENFKEIFKDSPIKRTKFQGIKRNLSFIQNPSTDEPISSASGKNA